jgi:hypothetical protein
MGEFKTTYLIEDYVNVRLGDPYRLFPFGKIVKGGKEHHVTPENAHTFKLPFFKAPIKIGSHKEETPAGGHIVGLEIRKDGDEPGIYAIPEYNDEGVAAHEKGAYRYHSPEIIWEDGALETPDGGLLEGPIIMGDALLHTPHLGEAAALYHVEPFENTKEVTSMGEDTVSIPILKQVADLFRSTPIEAATLEVEPVVTVPEDYEAVKKEKVDLEAWKADKLEAEAKSERLTAIRKDFDTEEFGAAFTDLGKAEESAEMLSRMDDDVRAWVMTNFKALSTQIKESKLTEELGSEGEGDTEGKPLGDHVVEYIAAHPDVDYNGAVAALAREKPELFKQYGGGA